MKTIVYPPFTFGWELEATERAGAFVPDVVVDHDGSVSGDALEYRINRRAVSDPLRSLAALRKLATDPHIRTDSSCGFHVHIGLGRRDRKIHHWAAWFVTLAKEVEKKAFQAVPASRPNSFCRSWKKASQDGIIGKEYSRNKHSNEDRYNWVNPVEIFRPGGIRTIEVRLMGDTHNYLWLLSWVSVCRLMARSAWTLIYDPSELAGEVLKIERYMEAISFNFRTGTKSVPRVRLALEMASDTGLRPSRCRFPLENLRNIEADIILQNYDENKKPKFKVGDFGLCVKVPRDGNMTIGNYYRIVSMGDAGAPRVIGDTGQPWYCGPECLEWVTYQQAQQALRGRIVECAV